MLNLPRPTENDVATLDAIIEAKRSPRKALLLSARTTVTAAYAAQRANPVGIPGASGLAQAQRDALVHAYEVETKPMTALRARLMTELALARCPFCSVSQSSTLDHYLPKEIYAQLSVFSLNLVPSCGHCNNLKSQKVLSGNSNVRSFVHPYFDSLPPVRFVFLSIQILGDRIGLRFSVKNLHGLPGGLFQQLQSHFELLGLGDRCRIAALGELRARARSFVRYFGPDGDSGRLSDELNAEADSSEADSGINSWRTVLYRTLAATPVFCNGGFRLIQ